MKTIGIVGGGQLGRMLTIPAKELGDIVLKKAKKLETIKYKKYLEKNS